MHNYWLHETHYGSALLLLLQEIPITCGIRNHFRQVN